MWESQSRGPVWGTAADSAERWSATSLQTVWFRRRAKTFEKMLTYADDINLYSGEIALTGQQIGNFLNPQRQDV
jgi:hypothetical protein